MMRPLLLIVAITVLASSCAMGRHTQADVASMAARCEDSHITVGEKRVRTKHVQISEVGSRNWIGLCRFPGKNLAADAYDVRKRDRGLLIAAVVAASPVTWTVLAYGTIIIFFFAGGAGTIVL